VTGDHVGNHDVSPYVVGIGGGIFDHFPTGVDTMIAYGGCQVINDFDQIEPIGFSSLEMTYGGTSNPSDGAVISHETTNALGNPVAVVLSGFSFHYIRDDRPNLLLDRVHHLADIIMFLGNIVDPICDAGGTVKLSNSLAQNFPNPFNPNTVIQYSIKERVHVTLKIYNVAGLLVRTLVHEEQIPKTDGYTVEWNGRSDSGNPVSSGVYFYKLKTKHFTQTKKMVLLK
jgi:hypothetical protein